MPASGSVGASQDGGGGLEAIGQVRAVERGHLSEDFEVPGWVVHDPPDRVGVHAGRDDHLEGPVVELRGVAGAVAAHVDRDHPVPGGPVPAARAEAGVPADHRETTPSLGDQLDRPVDLLGREGRLRDVAANHHVVTQQLLAGGGIALAGVVDPEEVLLGIHLGVDRHRQAFDVGVLDEGVADVGIFRVLGAFHVDDADLVVPGGDLERDAVVLGDRLAGQGEDLGHERRMGAVGLDDQLGRLVAVDEGQRQGRQRADVGAGGRSDGDLGASAREPPAADHDLDRDLAALRGFPRDDQVADRDVARSGWVADRQDVDRHAELLVSLREFLEAGRLRRPTVGEDEHAEGRIRAEPGRQALEGVKQPRLVVTRLERLARRDRREGPAEAIPLDARHPLRRDRGLGPGDLPAHPVEPGRRPLQAHAPRPVDQEHGGRAIAGNPGLDRPDRVEQDRDQHRQRRRPEHHEDQRPGVRRPGRPSGQHQQGEQAKPDRDGELDCVGAGPFHRQVPWVSGPSLE